jgi:hypothetical protein
LRHSIIEDFSQGISWQTITNREGEEKGNSSATGKINKNTENKK